MSNFHKNLAPGVSLRDDIIHIDLQVFTMRKVARMELGPVDVINEISINLLNLFLGTNRGD